MNKGFSLVELIVVIAIMAVLAGVAVPVYSAYTKNAEETVDENYAAEVHHAAEIAAALNGVDYTQVAVAADGSFTLYNGTTKIEGDTDDAKTSKEEQFIADVDATIAKKQALKSAKYTSGIVYNGTTYTAGTTVS